MADPTCGRVLHFVDEKGVHWPAFALGTTEDKDGGIGLIVFFVGRPGEPHFAHHKSVKQATPSGDTPAPAWTWHYPEFSPTAPGATNGPAALSEIVRKSLSDFDARITELGRRLLEVDVRTKGLEAMKAIPEFTIGVGRPDPVSAPVPAEASVQ